MLHAPQASKTHYCIHKTVATKSNVDEECDRLLEDRSCRFFQNVPHLLSMQTSASLQVCPTLLQGLFALGYLKGWR
jgi:hypothetical protein